MFGGFKNDAWSMQNRGLEGPKSRSRGLLGRYFKLLATVWTILKASGAVLAGTWGGLGSGLGDEEAVLRASWEQVAGIGSHPRTSKRF